MPPNAVWKGAWPIQRIREMLASGLRPYLITRLAKEVATSRTPEDWVRFAFNYRIDFGPEPFGLHFSLRPFQLCSEITRLLDMIAYERPSRVLEIGIAAGGTLFLFARAAAPEAVLIGIGLPPHEGGPDWRAIVYERAFAAQGQRIRIVRGDSHSEVTKARVLDVLRGDLVDFLFIDADHTYEGVRRDFELYTPLVRPGGLIGIHDIVRDSFHRTGVRTSSDSGEVFRFWSELKKRHPNREGALEIVEDPGQDGYGIGVLRA